ncbi:MAG: DUF5132 domain-containing protein [Bdellovibrionia bacterium]
MSISSFGMGFAVGYGSGLFSRALLPIAREIVSPVFRVTIRLAVKVVETGREAVSRLGETVEDIFAEVSHDMKQEKRKKKRVRSKPVVVSTVERAA